MLTTIVRLLREELQLLQEPGSYIGEVVKVMGKKKVLVKVQPEGKYGWSLHFPFVPTQKQRLMILSSRSLTIIISR
jgi:ATP-dependent 26S proteasome regulatory subunit